jgi:3',5'-cyclic AMP phosphodiesterase CpdA
MSALLQISDTHFGTEVPKVMRALIAMAHALSPELLVLSGDVTQRARRHQFEAAARFVKRLRVPSMLCVPGNHDIPLFALASRFARPYAQYARSLGEQLEPVFESERLLVQGVNTTRWFRHKHGQISEAQIARLGERLRSARPEQLRVVVTHQPLMAIRESDRNNLVRGHALAARSLGRAGADVFLGGHIHLPYVRQLTAAGGSVGRDSWVVQAGTAVSHRLREGVPNSVNVLRYALTGPAQCEVERWDYKAEVDRFVPVLRTPLRLSREPESASASL